MPKIKRPRRRAYLYAKGGMARTTLVPLSAPIYEDPLVEAEQKQVDAAIRYADGSRRPAGFTEFEVDPRFGDMWFRRAAVFAFAAQMRILMRALGKDATRDDFREANVAARNVQDRLFGKPIEKMAVAGRVKIEFGGLNPDAFPQAPKDAQSEVVDIPSDTGTEEGE